MFNQSLVNINVVLQRHRWNEKLNYEMTQNEVNMNTCMKPSWFLVPRKLGQSNVNLDTSV